MKYEGCPVEILEDDDLSFMAKGIFCYLWMKKQLDRPILLPDETSPLDFKDEVTFAIEDLEYAGYLKEYEIEIDAATWDR